MSLRIEQRSAPRPLLVATGSSSVQEWRLPDGTVWAYGHEVEGERWLDLPGVGTYLLADDEGGVTAFPAIGADDEAVRDAYGRIVVPLTFQAHRGEVMHASAVRVEGGGVVAFCADSQGGKSTMAYGLSRRGHEMWADDAVCLDFSKPTIETVSLPFVLRLRAPSAQYFFGDAGADESRSQAPQSDSSSRTGAPLQAVFFLERDPDMSSPPVALPVPPGAAFVRVLRQAGCFTLQNPDRKKLMMERYLELSAAICFYELLMPADLSRLDEALDCIEACLRGN